MVVYLWCTIPLRQRQGFGHIDGWVKKSINIQNLLASGVAPVCPQKLCFMFPRANFVPLLNRWLINFVDTLGPLASTQILASAPSPQFGARMSTSQLLHKNSHAKSRHFPAPTWASRCHTRGCPNRVCSRSWTMFVEDCRHGCQNSTPLPAG
jgi:hypothetical protein